MSVPFPAASYCRNSNSLQKTLRRKLRLVQYITRTLDMQGFFEFFSVSQNSRHNAVISGQIPENFYVLKTGSLKQRRYRLSLIVTDLQ